MSKKTYKILSLLLCILLVFEQSGFAQMAGQLDISGYLADLRNALTQDKFRPLHLRYLSYNTLNNNFRLLLDKGDLKDIKTPQVQETTQKLLEYFFVGVSLPNSSFWVNLRPDSPDNIIDPYLAQTDAGKILLEADLQLKKDTAKYTSPENPKGKEYWEKLYKKAGELFGYDNITIPTLTRPWIVPDEIIVREANDNAYIYKATLKVQLEQDHLKNSAVYNFDDPRLKELNEYSSQLIRELIIPELTKEINISKRYAPLRQVYYSLILAQWFKQKFSSKGGFYSSLIDRQNLNGITSKEDWSKTTYFKEYQKSFQKGEYNISEPISTPFGQTIRSYFSGGIDFGVNQGTGGGIAVAIQNGLVQAATPGDVLAGNSHTLPVDVNKGGTSDNVGVDRKAIQVGKIEGLSLPEIQSAHPQALSRNPFADRTVEQILNEIEQAIPRIEIWSQGGAPLDPESSLDFAPQQMKVVQGNKPLEFTPGLLYHGRDGLDEIIMDNSISGRIPLSRVAHQWATGDFNNRAKSPAIFAISTAVFNTLDDEGKATLKIIGERSKGFIDPYPEITVPLSLDSVEEIWIDMDTYERYKAIVQNPTTDFEKSLKPKLESMFRDGKFKVIPYLRHTQLKDGASFDASFTNVGRYMMARGLFGKMPLLKEKIETPPSLGSNVVPKPHFGHSGNEVDGAIIEAQKAIQGGDIAAALSKVKEAIRLLREVDFDDLDASGYPVADMVNQVEVAIWVLAQLESQGIIDKDVLELSRQLKLGVNGLELKQSLGYKPKEQTASSPAIEVGNYANSIVDQTSADIAVLTLQTDDRAIRDLSDELGFRFNQYEGAALLSLLHHPSKSRKEIEARQKMVEALTNLTNNERQSLSKSKSALYGLLISITKLLDNDTREDLVSLAEKSEYNAGKFKELLGKEKAREAESIADIRTCILGIEQYQGSIEHFMKEFERIDDPLAQAMLGIFKNKSAEFKVPTLQDILTALREKRHDALSELASNALTILNIATKIGMFIEFAQLTKDDGYGKATFNDNSPATYGDGWNFMRRKEGQIRNPSGKDTTIKLLTGSNMSGKSFFLVQNLFIQLVGQSFGFIPAASGNLRIYDQIVFIDRASTNAMMNLSAFGSEVNKWKAPLEGIGKRALYLVDEGFSTTSPDDQAKLLTGACNFLRDNNAHAILATHNEKFIATQQQTDTGTYHFETIINADALRQQDEDRDRYSYDKKEPVTFTHKLKDGFDDSKALEVAAQLGLQGRLIARAREFLAGNIAPIAAAGSKTLPKVTAYSEEERERLKKKRGSFLSFFPYEDVLVERKDAPSFRGEPAPLEWKYDMGNPHERRYYGDDERRPKFKFDPIFALFSGDHDFSPWSIDYVDYGVLKNQEILQGIHRLVMLGPSRDPREILERQQMFKAIMSDKNTSIAGEDWKVSTMLQRLGTYLEGFTLGAESPFDRFNLYLLLQSLEESTEHMATEERTELFIKILEMNLVLNGSSLEKAGVADDVAKVMAIWKLRKELRAFSDKMMSRKSESDKDRQEIKAGYEDLRVRVKQLTGGEDLIHVEYGTEEIIKPILIRIFSKATGVEIHKDVPIGFLIEDLKGKKSIGNLKAVSALEPENWDMIDKMLEGLMPTIEKEIRSGMGLFVAEHIRFCQQLKGLLYKGDALTECTEWLKSYDSVHLHQIANYFEFILRPIIGNIKNGREYLSELGKIKTDFDKAKADKAQWEQFVKAHDYNAMLAMSATHLKQRRAYLTKLLKERSDYTDVSKMIENIDVLLKATKDGVGSVDKTRLEQAIKDFLIEDFGRSIDSAEYDAKYRSSGERRRRLDQQQVWAEFSKLVRIFALAFVIKDNGWHEVTFTDKPELDVTNAWSIVKTKKEQVRNSARFDSAEMVRLYSGSNMSGKTFHLKQLIWAILAAQATGFAPCDGMISPVFDKVIYIDRVKAESDRNISAFGLEAKYWKDFFEYASRTGFVFGGVDEAGSTTSPKYQSALSYAIAEEMLGLGNMLAMASHNHDFLDVFHDVNKSHVGIYHFKTHEGEDGSIAFDYTLEDGHEPSNAIKVAEKLGLSMVTRLIDAPASSPSALGVTDSEEDHATEGNVAREDVEAIAKLADSSGAKRILLPTEIVKDLEDKFGQRRVGPVEVVVVAQPFMHTIDNRPINGPVRLGSRIFVGDNYFAGHNNDLRSILAELGHEAMAQWIAERRPDLNADAHELAKQLEEIIRVGQEKIIEENPELNKPSPSNFSTNSISKDPRLEKYERIATAIRSGYHRQYGNVYVWLGSSSGFLEKYSSEIGLSDDQSRILQAICNDMIKLRDSNDNLYEEVKRSNFETILDATIEKWEMEFSEQCKLIYGISARIVKFFEENNTLVDNSDRRWAIHFKDLALMYFDSFANHYVQQKPESLPIIDISTLECFQERSNKGYFKSGIPSELFVRGDGFLLNVLFDNLIMNAFSYSYDVRGAEGVRIDIKFEKTKDTVNVIISDNGSGIPSDKLAEIFNLAYSTSGGGVGLTVAYCIVKDIGGTIDVQSEVGKGTTFIIRLPIAQDTQSPKVLGVSTDTGSSATAKSVGSTNQPTEAETKSSPPVGGVDFRALPIVTQPLNAAGQNTPLNRLGNFSVDPEWKEIQNMVNAGIIPSGQRIKDYLQSCCHKKELNGEIGRVLNCIADIMRIEEERVSATDQDLKSLLVLLESGKPENELGPALSKIKFSPQEPQLITP